MVLVCGTIALAGCSKDGGTNTKEAAVKIPEGYQQYTFDNSFYGIRLSLTLPTFEEAEDIDNTTSTSDAYHKYKLYTNKAEYHYASVDAHVGINDDYSKESSAKESGKITVTSITIDGKETNKRDLTANQSSGKEVEYHIYDTLADGFAEANIRIGYINEDLSEEQWNELIEAVEKYTTLTVLEENQFTTADGRLMDNSNTMAFANPSTIAGQTAALKQTFNRNEEKVIAELTVDGIPYKINALGDVNESVYTSRKENTEEYTAVTVGEHTYYCHMINRFPNVECDLYVEIGGIYYEFYVYRDHDLDVDGNKAFVADTDNNKIFAEMVDELISQAEINTANYMKK